MSFSFVIIFRHNIVHVLNLWNIILSYEGQQTCGNMPMILIEKKQTISSN